MWSKCSVISATSDHNLSRKIEQCSLSVSSLASHFVPLQASPAWLLGRFAPSGFALAFWITLLPWASYFALAFWIASLLLASCVALAFSVALLPQAMCSHSRWLCNLELRTLGSNDCARFALCAHQKCVSIDSKRSETHRNAKNYYFDPVRATRSAKRERRSAILHTPCHNCYCIASSF